MRQMQAEFHLNEYNIYLEFEGYGYPIDVTRWEMNFIAMFLS